MKAADGYLHLEWSYLKAAGVGIRQESDRMWRFFQPWLPRDEDLNAIWYHPSAMARKGFADALRRTAPGVPRCLEWPAVEGSGLPVPSLLADWIEDEVWWMVGRAVDLPPIAHLIIRPVAHPAQRSDYLGLWQDAFGSWRPDLLTQRLQLAGCNLNQPGMGAQLAYWGNVPVGACDFFHERAKVRVENLWVDPAYRGHGVGSRLLAAVGLPASTTLAAMRADPDLFSFYDSAGFRRLACQRLWMNPEW